MRWDTAIFEFMTYIIFGYSAVLIILYIIIGVFSVAETKKYANKNSFIDYKLLAVSPYAPSISILAPAFNEGANIIENVRSLLSIFYNNLEIIIINDGSKDDSLDLLIKAYDLIKINFAVNQKIPTKDVIGVYRSKNPVYKKLVIVDKINGGKADALNVGINIASNDYIVCIDVDCVLEQDALLKLMKPFLDTTGEKVIATGGVVRIANSCEINKGRLVKVKLPQKYLPRMQALEYIRAFLLGRMAWSKLNGLLIISGAFGAFDKEIVIKAGGYDHKTVGEDMELVVRMRRYMEELDLPYKIAFIPDPLCWTEAPENYKILGRQRNRWTRGTIETLRKHKKIFFNRRYRLLGMVSYPYWFFFEMCAPGIEIVGMGAFLVMAILKIVYWQSFFAFLAFIISFGYLYSAFAVYMEVKTYNQYKRRTDVMKLLLTALTEPFVFHPFIVWSGVRGYIDKMQNKSTWGVMTRQGLNSNQPSASHAVAVESAAIPKPAIAGPITVALPGAQQKAGFLSKLKTGVQQAAAYNLIIVVCMLIIKTYELVKDVQLHGMPAKLFQVAAASYLNELSFASNIFLFSGILFTTLFFVNKKLAHVVVIVFSVFSLLIHAALSQYFLETLVPLGADLFNYSFAEIHQTVSAAVSITPSFVISIMLGCTALISIFIFLPKKIRSHYSLAFGLIIIFASARLILLTQTFSANNGESESNNNLTLNKSAYFYSSAFNYRFGTPEQTVFVGNDPIAKKDSLSNHNSFNYIDDAHFPFLHSVDTTTDVLSPFFNKKATAPNFVFIIVEGLGRAFSNKDAYLGSFTPFLDSLSDNSLYWSNFLSAGGRTFAVLPSIFGSLPYAKNGFVKMGDEMPAHLSLLNILKSGGYRTSFSYGGDAGFDNMNLFLQKNGTTVLDKSSFGTGYKTMPSASGFSWGYDDEEVFKKYHNSPTATQPYCDVVLTLSTHSPFLIHNQDKYLSLFEKRMQTLGFTEEKKQEHRFYKNQYASILYSDNAIRQFINTYSNRSDFSNTIFIITGDHRLPEIPLSTKIDRYHVPLIIYSPLLKQSKKFASVSSHLDITPSILSFMSHQYNFPAFPKAAWLGSGLDTTVAFRNIHEYPLIQSKNDLVDFIMDDYMLNGDHLYRMTDKMHLQPVEDEVQKKKLQYAFALFHQRNNKLIQGAPLLPPSITIR